MLNVKFSLYLNSASQIERQTFIKESPLQRMKRERDALRREAQEQDTRINVIYLKAIFEL